MTLRPEHAGGKKVMPASNCTFAGFGETPSLPHDGNVKRTLWECHGTELLATGASLSHLPPFNVKEVSL